MSFGWQKNCVVCKPISFVSESIRRHPHQKQATDVSIAEKLSKWFTNARDRGGQRKQRVRPPVDAGNEENMPPLPALPLLAAAVGNEATVGNNNTEDELEDNDN
jgi:hypothetical protein